MARRLRYNLAAEALPSLLQKAPEALWEPHPRNTAQQLALRSEADQLFFGGAAGVGKGMACYGLKYLEETGDQPPDTVLAQDTQVLDWRGKWRPASLLQPGDRIMNPDGQAQTILFVHDRGCQDFYRVTFEDGTFVECDGDHLWGVWECRGNSRRKTMGGVKEVFRDAPTGWQFNYISRCRVLPTAQLKGFLDSDRRFQIPLCAPLNFTGLCNTDADRAYVYGALIGDGSLGTSIRLHSPDQEIIDRVTAQFEKFSIRGDESCRDVLLSDNWIYQWARRCGLNGCRAEEKHLPDWYLAAPLDFRWALAQGLFDTDGYASPQEVSYCTVSRRLADGVAALARSLGFMAKIRTKEPTYTYQGEKRQGKTAYTVYVQGNGRDRLFYLNRKRESALGAEPRAWVGKRIESIEPVGRMRCRCITVSNPNGLYLTDFYNVTHNSDMLLGCALTQHDRSIIFRREHPQLRSLISRAKEIAGLHGKWNGQDKVLTLPGGRTLEFGAVQYEESVGKYQGRAFSFHGFDELTSFTELQFRTLIGWNRSANPKERCRIIATGNPPVTAAGEWVRQYWGPWLDKGNPLYPAKPGELLWFATIDGKDQLLDGPNPVDHEGEVIYPHSRTFIPGTLDQNPYLAQTNYRSTLQSLPEPLRSLLLFGFDAQIDMADEPFQLIPSAWVRAAQQRYSKGEYSLEGSKGIGCDPARGGGDRSVIAYREGERVDYWAYPGHQTPDGGSVVALVLERWTEGTPINIDVIGIGGSVVDVARGRGLPVRAIDVSAKSHGHDRTGVLGFANLRAEIFWKLRESLDPEFGATLALPPDPQVLTELTAYQWTVTHQGIRLEPKPETKKRLGRSPDIGDAIALACYVGGGSYTPSFDDVPPGKYQRPGWGGI